jgi:hypothetical protein
VLKFTIMVFIILAVVTSGLDPSLAMNRKQIINAYMEINND